jgi:hypothetical protein
MYEPEERRSALSGLIIPLGVVVVAGIAIAAIVLGLGLLDGGDDEDEPVVQASPTAAASPTPTGANPAEVAIGQYVSSTLGATYAGDCSAATINQQPPTGATGPAPTHAPASDALCSQARGEREQVQAYVLGRPLQDPSHWVFVRQNGGAFAVVSAPEITPESAAVGGIPWPITPGSEVVVTGAAPCLNVREGPALNQAAVDCIADGTTIVVASGPVDADGYQWWQVDGRAGWVVGAYLRYADAQ